MQAQPGVIENGVPSFYNWSATKKIAGSILHSDMSVAIQLAQEEAKIQGCKQIIKNKPVTYATWCQEYKKSAVVVSCLYWSDAKKLLALCCTVTCA